MLFETPGEKNTRPDGPLLNLYVNSVCKQNFAYAYSHCSQTSKSYTHALLHTKEISSRFCYHLLSSSNYKI